MSERNEAITEEVLLRHSGWMRALARRLLDNTDRADDVIQETWLAMVRKPPRHGRATQSWLATVLRNFAFRSRQVERDRRRREQAVSRSETTTMGPEQLVERADLQRRVVDAVLRLQEPYRSTVLMRFFEGLSVGQISKESGVPVSTVKTRLARAMDQLRTALDRQYGSDRGAWAVLLTPWAVDGSGPSPADLSTGGVGATGGGITATIGGTLIMKKVLVSTVILLVLIATSVWVIDETRSTQSGDSEVAIIAPPGELEDSTVTGVDATESSILEPSAAPPPEVDPNAPEADTAVITGLVHDPEGDETFAGARVIVDAHLASDGKRFTLTTETDEGGRFHLENLALGEYRFRSLEIGRWKRRVGETVEVSKAGETIVFDIPVSWGITIRGRVVDEEERPLPGVRVRAMSSQENRIRESISLTGPDGSFEIPDFEGPSTDVMLQADREGYAMPSLRRINLKESGIEGLVLRMVVASSFSGIVVDGQGQPVEGAGVLAAHVGEGLDRFRSTVETDGNGAFFVDGLNEGLHNVIVVEPGSSLVSLKNVNRQVELHRGQSLTGLRLVLASASGLSISGTVTDSSGRPLGEVLVQIVGPTSKQTVSDRKGHYRVDGLEDGPYTVSARDMRFDRSVVEQEVQSGRDDVDLIFAELAFVSGTVVDRESGDPIKDFELTHAMGILDRPDHSALWQYRQVKDAEGRFAIPGVRPGDLTVFVRAAGYAQQARPVREVLSGQTVEGIIVELSRGTLIEGHVRDEQGRPVPDARIYLGPRPPVQHLTRSTVTIAGLDGKFEVRVQPVLSQVLSAHHSSFAGGTVELDARGPHVAGVVVHLARGGDVEGNVTIDGESLAQQHVSAYVMGSRYATVPTDENGAYRIEHLPAGEATLSVSLANETVRVGTESLRVFRSIDRSVVLRDHEVVRADLSGASGTAAIEGTVAAPETDDEELSVSVVLTLPTGAGSSLNLQLRPGANGAYRFEGLPEGEARIEAKLRRKGIVMGRTEVTARLASGQTVVRDLQVLTEEP